MPSQIIFLGQDCLKTVLRDSALAFKFSNALGTTRSTYSVSLFQKLATLSGTNIYWDMKKIAYFILLVVVGSGLAISQALAQKKAATGPAAAAAESKMTKEQAEHAVMKKYPAAKIVSCEQKTINGKSVWMVKFTETGGNIAQQMMVDETGKLTRM
jgi:hypothetical protein